MYSAVSGQLAVYKHIEVIANNLANMNTTGFRSERPLFEKALGQQAVMASGSMKKDIVQPAPFKSEDFVQVRGTFTDFTQGPIEVTNQPLDVALDGEGLFVVSTPSGERYTRAGNFRLDETGRLVTQNGSLVQGSGGDITLKSSNVNISRDGTISEGGEAVGKLRVVNIDSKMLVREARQLFRLTPGAQVVDANDPRVQAGAVEGSNVNAVRELADMILASRLYEGFKSAQDSSSKMNEQRNQHVGTVQA